MPLTDKQLRFLEQLALRIPDLFEAIRQGSINSEYVIGVRRIGRRYVRLTMVAEVVDAGPNPLQTHSMLQPVRRQVQHWSDDEGLSEQTDANRGIEQFDVADHSPAIRTDSNGPAAGSASKRRRPRKR